MALENISYLDVEIICDKDFFAKLNPMEKRSLTIVRRETNPSGLKIATAIISAPAPAFLSIWPSLEVVDSSPPGLITVPSKAPP